MTVTSGLKCSELLRQQDPVGCCVKMLLATSRWVSTLCYLNWSPSATPGGRLLFRLVPSMPDTEETEYGLWPTPNVPNGGRTMSPQDALNKGRTAKGKRQVGLENAVKFWPTPTCQDAKNNGAPSQMERNTKPLNAEVGGALNPEWVEWLMGYPVGWTDLRDSETPSSRKSPPKSSAQ